MKNKRTKMTDKIVKDFFTSKLKENPKLTIESAILLFEDIHEKHKNLDKYAKKRDIMTKSYIKAYNTLYKKAKKY